MRSAFQFSANGRAIDAESRVACGRACRHARFSLRHSASAVLNADCHGRIQLCHPGDRWRAFHGELVRRSLVSDLLVLVVGILWRASGYAPRCRRHDNL